MPDINTVQNWQGRTMVDRDGDKLGTIDAIYLDDDTGQPEWGLIYTGLFGTKATFVPLAQARPMGDSVQVPYHRDQVKDAPNMQADGQLSQDEEAELYRHYGLDDGQHRSEEEHEVTLREEEVVVDRRAVPKERVRLGTETVTEERQVSEEVRKEQIQVHGDQDQLPRRDRR
jgi:Domain of unknown function (DUF2382)/PRC-barrel domain